MDKNYIYQIPIREWIECSWGKEVLIPIYGNKKDEKWDIFFQSSSGTGHRKGKSYQKVSKVFDVQKENYAETFLNILEETNSFLNYIESNLDKLL